jgi:opacity protein-like surface antigen
MFAINHRGRNMKKFVTTLALLTVIATPAFAQSFDPENGTGNVLSLQSGSTATRNDRFAVRQHGLHAQAMVQRTRTQNHRFAVRQNGQDAQAMVPRTLSAPNSNSPASTGGGSLGYNEMLRIY